MHNLNIYEILDCCSSFVKSRCLCSLNNHLISAGTHLVLRSSEWLICARPGVPTEQKAPRERSRRKNERSYVNDTAESPWISFIGRWYMMISLLHELQAPTDRNMRWMSGKYSFFGRFFLRYFIQSIEREIPTNTLRFFSIIFTSHINCYILSK